MQGSYEEFLNSLSGTTGAYVAAFTGISKWTAASISTLSILLPKTEGKTGRDSDRISRGSVDALRRGSGRANSRFKIVLRFVVTLVRHVVDVEVQIHPRSDALRNGEIHDIQS